MAVAPFTSADSRRPRRPMAGVLRPVLEGYLPVASASPRDLPCDFLGQILQSSLFRRRRGALVRTLDGAQLWFISLYNQTR
jgi:hypothetical protein